MDLNTWGLVEVPWGTQHPSVVTAWSWESGKPGFLLKLSSVVLDKLLMQFCYP